MSRVTIETRTSDALEDILDPGERVLWTGKPAYGRALWQIMGAERVFAGSMAAGVIAFIATLPFIPTDGTNGPVAAYAVYSVVTIVFLALTYIAASNRQYVLWNVLYIVTNKRAILCRRGRNWRLEVKLYVIANPHSTTYPYQITPTRPYPTLTIGTILDPQELQPLGHGLMHPGQPVLWGRFMVPVAFEQIPDAEAVFALIHAHATDT